jgi:hypothetical protein
VVVVITPMSSGDPESGRETPLLGGHCTPGVVLVGATVRRSTGPHTPFVHAVLRRLEGAGVPAPRVLGTDAMGREILAFVPGATGHGRYDWSDSQLAVAANLCAAMHDACAGSYLAGAAETVCHGDLAPWNVVITDDGTPRVFIDFDSAAPGARVDDLAYLAWTFCALGDPARSPTAQAHRLRVLADAYAACTGRRLHTQLVGALRAQQNKVRSWRANQAHTAPDPQLRSLAGRRVAEIDDQIRWMRDHHHEFTSALG